MPGTPHSLRPILAVVLTSLPLLAPDAARAQASASTTPHPLSAAREARLPAMVMPAGVRPRPSTRAVVRLQETPAPPPRAGGWRLVAGGVVGGAVGALAGYGVGRLFGECVEDGFTRCEGPNPADVLAVAGEVLGLGLGVHTANRPRGNVALTTLGSAAGAALAVALFHGTEEKLAVLVPATQLALAIPLDRWVAR